MSSSWGIMKRAVVHSRSLGEVAGATAPPFSHAKSGSFQPFVALLVVAVKPPAESGSAIALSFREGLLSCEHTKIRECATIMYI